MFRVVSVNNHGGIVFIRMQQVGKINPTWHSIYDCTDEGDIDVATLEKQLRISDYDINKLCEVSDALLDAKKRLYFGCKLSMFRHATKEVVLTK